jgi:hypothetical protein
MLLGNYIGITSSRGSARGIPRDNLVMRNQNTGVDQGGDIWRSPDLAIPGQYVDIHGGASMGLRDPSIYATMDGNGRYDFNQVNIESGDDFEIECKFKLDSSRPSQAFIGDKDTAADFIQCEPTRTRIKFTTGDSNYPGVVLFDDIYTIKFIGDSSLCVELLTKLEDGEFISQGVQQETVTSISLDSIGQGFSGAGNSLIGDVYYLKITVNGAVRKHIIMQADGNAYESVSNTIIVPSGTGTTVTSPILFPNPQDVAAIIAATGWTGATELTYAQLQAFKGDKIWARTRDSQLLVYPADLTGDDLTRVNEWMG